LNRAGTEIIWRGRVFLEGSVATRLPWDCVPPISTIADVYSMSDRQNVKISCPAIAGVLTTYIERLFMSKMLSFPAIKLKQPMQPFHPFCENIFSDNIEEQGSYAIFKKRIAWCRQNLVTAPPWKSLQIGYFSMNVSGKILHLIICRLFYDTLTRRVSHCANFIHSQPLYRHSEKDQVWSPGHRVLKTPQLSKTPYSSWKSDAFQRFSCDSARESQGVLRQRIGPPWVRKTPHVTTWNRRICRRFHSFTKFSAWIQWREFSWHVFSTERVCMTWE